MIRDILKSIVCLFRGHDDEIKSLVTTNHGERFLWARVCERCGRCVRAEEDETP